MKSVRHLMKERRGGETKPAPTTTHNTTHSRMPTSQPQSRLITLSCCSYSRAESGSFRQHVDRPSWLFLAVTCRTSSASFTQHRQNLSPVLCTIGYLTLYIITNTTPPIPSLESRSVFSLKLIFRSRVYRKRRDFLSLRVGSYLLLCTVYITRKP